LQPHDIPKASTQDNHRQYTGSRGEVSSASHSMRQNPGHVAWKATVTVRMESTTQETQTKEKSALRTIVTARQLMRETGYFVYARLYARSLVVLVIIYVCFSQNAILF